jgi:hypothetical protein
MTEPSKQEVLDKLLDGLKSGMKVRQLYAIFELGNINISSEAVAHQLEKLALGEDTEVRAAALEALKLKTVTRVAEKKSKENLFLRTLLVKEIDTWESDGLIEPHRAEVLRRRYDYDFEVPPEEPEMDTPKIAAPEAAPAPVHAQPEPATVPEPRPSLIQVLLSETSIKIYLYLGAFFVIAAAAILAALVEAARLPVLLIATAAFATGAVLFKKRLPQPSFALAIVFSFLLPIDANVIAEQLVLSPAVNEIYWTLVFLIMAVIWTFGMWFYASRLFSGVAFFSLLLSAYRFGGIFDASMDWIILSVAAANLLALLGVGFIKKWNDQKFAIPLFLLTQLTQLALIALSFISVIVNLFDSGVAAGNWIASALTWLLAASFFATSDLLIAFPLFPWMATASLYPLPWLFLSTFDASMPTMLTGFAVWGTLATFASEMVKRTGRAAWTKYHFPLLALSLPLLVAAVLFGLVYQDMAITFATFLSAGVMYTIVNVLRPRWYVWLTGLVFGLAAYFTFFALPFMEETNVHISYQLLGASLLLLIPELFFKRDFSFSRVWNWPAVVLGASLATFNILLVLIEFDYDKSAVVFGVSTLLSGAYALRFRQPLIGYLATISTTLTIVFSLQFYERDWWLPSLTALSALYYAAGFLLAREERTKPWGAMFVISGLLLGGLISLLAAVTLKDTGGWYSLIVAVMFMVEIYTRKNGWLEIFAVSAASIALILLHNDFDVFRIHLVLFSLSLLWFTSDVVFKLTLQNRKLELPVKGIGVLLTLAASLSIVLLNVRDEAAYFGVYTLFFAAYAWLHKNPLFGYASTLALALTVYFGGSSLNVDEWTFPQTALAVIFYAAGFILRHMEKAKGWDSTLLLSGLGLGTFVALLAPWQAGGLESAILIAIAATFYAAEAFERRNVWLGFPTNGLYLMSYFVLLGELKVDEPQFYSVGAAALGLLQHYLLRRAGQKSAAFLMGMLSQLVLLGTSYIQMVETGELNYFFLLLFQFLAMLAYGIVVRSRSLVIAPIAIVVLAVLTILYNALKDLSLVIIIGVTGLILLSLGILAVVMRERITSMAERFSDWDV